MSDDFTDGAHVQRAIMSALSPAPVSVDAAFERVWAVVKDWDISTEPGSHRLYEGINGDHVRAIVAAALDVSPANERED